MDIPQSIHSYLASAQLADLAPGTVRIYRLQLGVLARWLAARRVSDTADLSADLLTAYLVERRATLAQQTLCQQRSILHAWLAWLGSDLADTLPKVRRAHEDEIRRDWLPEEAVLELLERSSSARDRAILSVIFGAGLRVSEVAAMRREDLDLGAGELSIPRSKGNRPRLAALSESVSAALRTYLRTAPASEWVFTARHGGPFAPSTLARRVRKLGWRAGLEITTRMGRRFCLSKLAEQNLLAAKVQAGHAHLSTTMIYVRESVAAVHAVMRAHDPLRGG